MHFPLVASPSPLAWVLYIFKRRQKERPRSDILRTPQLCSIYAGDAGKQLPAEPGRSHSSAGAGQYLPRGAVSRQAAGVDPSSGPVSGVQRTKPYENCRFQKEPTEVGWLICVLVLRFLLPSNLQYGVCVCVQISRHVALVYFWWFYLDCVSC